MSYHHLNIRIEVFLKMGYWAKQIAGQLNRHHRAMARELK